MDQGYGASEVGKEERLLHCRVAAANHRDRSIAEKEAVAGGARRDTEPLEASLARQSQPSRRRTGADDHALAFVGHARIAGQHERRRSEGNPNDGVIETTGTDVHRLLGHLLHQPRPLHGRGKAWIVLDVGRNRQLATRLQPADQDRLQPGACGVDGRRVPGRPRPKDDDFTRVVHRLGSRARLSRCVALCSFPG